MDQPSNEASYTDNFITQRRKKLSSSFVALAGSLVSGNEKNTKSIGLNTKIPNGFQATQTGQHV